MSRPMKHSGVDWLGDIPADWSVTRIKYFYDCYDGRRVPVDSAERRSGPYPYWGAGSITDYVDDYLFDEELVLLGEDGAPFFDHTRPVAFLVNEKVWVNNHIHVLKPKPTVNSRFLVHWLNNVDYKSYINGSILNKLTQSNMNSIAFAFPPLDEQQRIANFLDEECRRIDSVIDKTRASIDEYKKLKQAIITRAVTKGIRPNRPTKSSGVDWLGDIPTDWDCTLLKRHCNFQTGSTPSTANNRWFNGKLDWFTPADFDNSYLLVNSIRKLSLLAKDDGVATIIPSNTVMIIGIGGTAGKIGFTTKECSCNQQITAIKADDKIYPKFLMYWMIANTTRLKNMALFTTLPIINNQTLGQYTLLTPPIDEQREIAAYLDEKTAAIDLLIAKKIQLAAELEQLKKSLIFEYVTGKKELQP